MWQSREVQFASGHPAADGHFPGNPIIPGALLLDEMLKAVAGGDSQVVIRSAKFFRPIRPGETVLLQWEMRAEGEIVFQCVLSENGELAVAGVLGVGLHDG